MKPPRVGLVGLGGYGAVHLQHLRDFHRKREIVFAAAVAFPPDVDGAVVAQCRAEGCEIFAGFDELLAALPRLKLNLAVVPTPIHWHTRMAVALMKAGVDVLVEKPLASTREDALAISTTRQFSGRMVAVGFQYLHAPEVLALKQKILAGAIGPLRRLTVHAAWPRSHAYYARNAWAGRLRVGADLVLDSPVSNAMSHFLMVMLFLAGRDETSLAKPVRIGAELYRAQAIESFDTAVVRMQTAEGLKLDFYGTHSSREIGRPSLTIEGTGGSAEWVQDSHARLTGPAGEWTYSAAPESNTRERMLRDVLARRRGEPAFICTPEMAAVHVACVTELHAGAEITTIPATYLSNYSVQGQEFTYVSELGQQLAHAAHGGLSLSEAGAVWAVQPGPLRDCVD
jgi:predicted dehydrogenase